MALSSAQTLCGFGSGLDWRPTCFVNPFPSSRVCSVCGLAPSLAAMLSCRHLLCHRCYDSVRAKRHHCTLDQEPFQEEDVVWSTFGVHSILKRKVRCWNAKHGCDAEDEASTMLQHFAKACQFHVVSCPRCSEGVLHRDIAEHVEYYCGSSRTREQPLEDNIANAFTEVKKALGKVLEENAALRTKFDSFEVRLRPEIDGALAAQSTIVAEAVKAALENSMSLLRTQADAPLPECRQVKEALNRLSEENSALQTKLDSLEERLDMNNGMARLSAIVSDDVRASAERTNSVCLNQTEVVLAEHRREITSRVRDALAINEQTISKECARNPLELGVKVVEAPHDDGRLACSAKMSAEVLTAPAENEARALQQLAVVSLSISSDFLSKSVPYEWSIDDWNEFLLKAPKSPDYSTDNDGQPSYHYGYLVVPRLCLAVGTVWLRVYIIEGLFDKFLKWPMDKNVKLLLINPYDCSRQLELKGALEPILYRTLPALSKKVVFVGCYPEDIKLERLNEHGLIINNKLRLRLQFEP